MKQLNGGKVIVHKGRTGCECSFSLIEVEKNTRKAKRFSAEFKALPKEEQGKLNRIAALEFARAARKLQ